jgi:NitT/TauT family transport system ATP-binding protein
VLFFRRPPHSTFPYGAVVLYQQDARSARLNVADNIVFGLRRDGVDGSEIARRLDDALRLMGLVDFAKAYPAQLSGGMRQRVCIARTLVMQPRMILLDEPFGALDAQTRLIMGDELLKVWRATGATVLLITHALDEAAMLSDRIGLMSARPGRIIEELETGWPRDRDSRVAADPAFGAITARLWSVLREESLKTMRQGKPL